MKDGKAQKNKKTLRMRTADYLKDFQCIGSACEDNCCIGWDVDIDKKTFNAYQRVKDEVLTKMFRKHVHLNPYYYSEEVDYGVVRLTKSKRCPFLNEERLCKIQAKLGESYLSNVCHTFPRYTNIVDGVYEHTATASCPEIARKMLLKPEGIRFVETEGMMERQIITNDLNTQMQAGASGLKKLTTENFIALRALSMEILQTRSYALWARVMILGYFCRDVEALKQPAELNRLLEHYRKGLKDGSLNELLADAERAGADQEASMAMVQEIADGLNVFEEVDSASYVHFSRQVLEGIGHGKASRAEQAKAYAEAAVRYYNPYMAEKSYVLENFLVNFVFKNLFPYSESYTMTEAYLMLVIRFALIQMNLTGLSAYHRGLSDELVVAYLQAFSKTVEHHRTYLDDMVKHLKGQKRHSLHQVAILLKN